LTKAILGIPTLRFYPSHSAENGDHPVQNPQATLDFYREINMTGSIDDVDAVISPQASCGGRSNRNPPLLLLLHPIHHRCSFMHLSHLV